MTEQQPTTENPTAENAEATPPEELRTLFLSGFPPDVKEREIALLFRPCAGYEGAHLRLGGKQPVAFAIFSDSTSAKVAMENVQGIQFDPDSPMQIRVEFAKSNSKPKRARPDAGSSDYYGSGGSFGDKRLRMAPTNMPPDQYGMYPGAAPAAVGHTYYGDLGPVWNQSLMNPNYGPLDQSTMYGHGGRGQRPCSTLFVANLGPQTSEQELRDLFGRSPGFQKLRLSGQGSPVAFVEYVDENYSTQALAHFQGYQLRSSRGPIRIEYAKSKMGIQRPGDATATAPTAVASPAHPPSGHIPQA